MSKYPRAFGICTPDGWWEILYEDSHTANLDANHKYEAGDFAGCEVVELIPLPEHEAIVAAAVKAERERCSGICDEYSREAEKNADNSMAPECDIARSRAADEIEHRIREVPS